MKAAGVPLAERVAARFENLVPPGGTCVVAVSGGPDSLALLDLLHLTAARHRRPLVVGHVDHGIDVASGAVAEAVASAAASRGLRFESRRLSLGAGASETGARVARRRALRSIAADVDAAAIAVAHHADDQAETVLLRFLHGSGPAGLAGMAPRHGLWVRPLLGIWREELTVHLAARGIAAWEDPANADPRHLRSWLRVEVLPMLQSRLPAVSASLANVARLAADARVAWGQAIDHLDLLHVQRSERGISVAAPALQGYRSALRHAVLAAMGREIGVPLGRGRLAAIERLLDEQAGSGQVALAKGIQAELAFGRLTFVGERAVSPGITTLQPGSTVDFDGIEVRVTIGRSAAAKRTGWRAYLMPAEYIVRSWRAGDRIRPLGGTGSRAVSVMLREASVPPSRRRSWPVIVTGDDATIVWVPGICRSDAAVPSEGSEAWRVECAIT